jgi:hypothetical protein
MQPLPYANVGIKSRNVGTVSNDSGLFKLDIPSQYTNDTLIVSIVGYEEIHLLLAEMSTVAGKHEYLMWPLNVKLDEFTFQATKLRERKYGLYKYHPIMHFLDASIQQDDAFEIAQRMRTGEGRKKVTSVNLHINGDRKDSGIFRINFYSCVGNRPGRRITEKSIVQTKAIRNGWLAFDVSKYNVYAEGDFIVGLEFIPNGKKGQRTVYEVKPGGRAKSFVRLSSQGEWQLSPAPYRMYITALTGEALQKEPDEEKEILPAFRMYSRNVHDSFSIFVRLPENYDRSKKYPVIFLLDANFYFSRVSDSIERMSMQPILVGIGYKDFAVMDSLRERDYTYPPMFKVVSNITGGGKQFYSFLAEELINQVTSRYSISDQRCLMGHSLGGYFVLYALYRDLQEGNNVFSNYCAVSPSVEYNDQYLAHRFEELNAGSNQVKQLSISWGQPEESEREGNIMYGDALHDFIKVITSDKFRQLKLSTETVPNAGHLEAALPGFYRGISILMSGK